MERASARAGVPIHESESGLERAHPTVSVSGRRSQARRLLRLKFSLSKRTNFCPLGYSGSGSGRSRTAVRRVTASALVRRQVARCSHTRSNPGSGFRHNLSRSTRTLIYRRAEVIHRTRRLCDSSTSRPLSPIAGTTYAPSGIFTA